MPCVNVLYCSLLCHFLCFVVLYCTLLYCTILHCAMIHCTVLHYFVVLCCTFFASVDYTVVQYYAILHMLGSGHLIFIARAEDYPWSKFFSRYSGKANFLFLKIAKLCTNFHKCQVRNKLNFGQNIKGKLFSTPHKYQMAAPLTGRCLSWHHCECQYGYECWLQYTNHNQDQYSNHCWYQCCSQYWCSVIN